MLWTEASVQPLGNVYMKWSTLLILPLAGVALGILINILAIQAQYFTLFP